MIEKSLEDDLRRLVKFLREHKEVRFDEESWLLYSKGCDGKFGGCCSRSCDLVDIIDKYKEEKKDD